MQQPPTCPHCQSAQAVQRVASIVTSGTQTVRVITPDFMPAAGVSRTNLARLLAPPRKPGNGWLIAIALIGLVLLSVPASCFLALVLTSLQGQSANSALASGSFERLFGVVIGFVLLALIVIGVVLMQLRERRLRPAIQQWNEQMNRWQQSWYCHRCHAAFVAGSSRAVAPEQFARVIAG